MAHRAGPVIDAHHHLWTIRVGSHPWLEGRALHRSFGASDYDRTFAGQEIAATVWIEALAADPMAELAEAEAVRQATDGRIGAALIAHVPLDAPDVEERLDACARVSPAFRGVRDILSPRVARAPDLLERPGFLAGLRALARRGLVFEAMLTPPQMRAAAALLAQVPDLAVALEHVGSPHDRSATGLALWQEGLDAFAALPGSIVKLSAMQCLEPGWTDASLGAILAPVAERFGAGRICVGTDWPVHDETCPGPEALDTLRRLTADWDAQDRRAVFATTAQRFYGIGCGT
ncbi:MAG: amidohydrolase family protein [Roseicyclus sp.]